jgi:hypothetical protein
MTRYTLQTALNRVFHKHRLQSSKKTVNVMQMMCHHDPKTRIELVNLLKTHGVAPKCRVCNQIVRGDGLRGWALNLQDAVKMEIDNGTAEPCLKDATITDHVHFVTKLYVTDPINGYRREMQALKDTDTMLHAEFAHLNLKGRHATCEEDYRYKVDIVYEGVFGIQVKPISYQRMITTNAWNQHERIHVPNLRANRLWGYPVLWLYYDEDGWDNMDQVANDIRHLLGKGNEPTQCQVMPPVPEALVVGL